MAAVTTGIITITTSGVVRSIGTKTVRARLRYAATGQTYPTSGIPFPTNPSAYGLKSRLDSVNLLNNTLHTPIRRPISLDPSINRIRIYDVVVTGVTATKKQLLEVAGGTVATGQFDLYVDAKGF